MKPTALQARQSRRVQSRAPLSDAVVQAVRETADVVAVAEGYTRLRKAGTQLCGLCPLHSERTPSFFVHPEKQLFHCHGCRAGGDSIALVMAVEKRGFVDAVRLLARQFGVAVDGPLSPEVVQRAEENRRKREAEKAFVLWAAAYQREMFQELYTLRRAARYAEAAIRGGAGRDIEERAWGCLARLYDFESWIDREQPLDTTNMRQHWEANVRRAA